MQRMDDAAFLAWLAEAGVGNASPRGSVWLAFAGPGGCARTWHAPDEGEARTRWLDAVVRAASAGGPWWLWRRGGGGWSSAREQITAAVLLAGVPRDFAGALGFAPDERERMMGIVRAFAAWPWGAADDLYLVPADRSCVVMLCHDDEIHVFAADRERLDAFGQTLSAGAAHRT